MISVIIPIYNVEKYLRRCVDSVLAQTYRDLEVFLVDDGSPDNCGAICDEYAQTDNRIIVIHKENGGLSDARNAALDKMSGEYVTFVDSDDYIAVDALESMLDSLIRTGSDIAVGNMPSFDEYGETGSFYSPYTEETVLEGEKLFETLLQPCAPNRLYRTELFETVRYPVGRYYEDVFVWHRILALTKRMVFTGKNAYYYFIRSGSIMHGEYNIRFTDIIDALKERYEWLESVGQQQLANDTRMFVYSRTAVAYAHLDKNNPEHKKRLDEIKVIYDDCCDALMRDKSVSVKQKIRLEMLKVNPSLHTRLFGKNMPIALG